MEFPCSDTFRGFSFQISGKDDPDSAHSPEPEPVIEPVFRPRPVDAEIDRLKGETRYLHQKITELLARKKKEVGYEPF